MPRVLEVSAALAWTPDALLICSMAVEICCEEGLQFFGVVDSSSAVGGQFLGRLLRIGGSLQGLRHFGQGAGGRSFSE